MSSQLLAKLKSDRYANFLGIQIKRSTGYAQANLTVAEQCLISMALRTGLIFRSLMRHLLPLQLVNQTAVALSFHIAYDDQSKLTRACRGCGRELRKSTALYKIVVKATIDARSPYVKV